MQHYTSAPCPLTQALTGLGANVYPNHIYIGFLEIMKITHVFMTGNSQVVRLSKEFRIDADRVEILKRGEETILRPLKRSVEDAFHLLAALPDDFMPGGRKDAAPQKRKSL